MDAIAQTPMMPLLFVCVALVSVLLTYVITRKLVMAGQTELWSTTQVKARGGEFPEDIPEEIARQLSLMIRYEPHGRGRERRVQIEERLMLGSVPLTNWVQHEEDVAESALDSHAIQQLSCLKLHPAREGVQHV